MEPDLLVALPKGGGPQIGICRLEPAARETHFSGVTPQMPSSASEHHRRTVFAVVDRSEDGRRWATLDVARLRFTVRIEEGNDIVDRHLPLARVQARPRWRGTEPGIAWPRYGLWPAAPDGRRESQELAPIFAGSAGVRSIIRGYRRRRWHP